jgi:hypothetical protein
MKNEKNAYKCDNFSIGAHGSSMQTRVAIQTFVPLANVPSK